MMNEKEKNEFLKNIRHFKTTELIKRIELGQITLEEILNAPGLTFQVRKELEIIMQEEEDFWIDCKKKDTQKAYEEYLSRSPNGKYSDVARSILLGIKQKITREKDLIFQRLKAEEYTVEDVKKLLDEVKITKLELIEQCGLSEEVIDKIKVGFERERLVASHWQNLPKLPEGLGYTDVYFFGIPASGKSCVLGSLIHASFTDAKYTFTLDIHNRAGRDYANLLRKYIRQGIVPPPTPSEEDTVNYISCSICYRESSLTRNYSIIEMSGEYFLKTYDSENLNGIDSIGARGYLSNSNRKAIFFVVDFKEDLHPTISNQWKVDQVGLFEDVLTKLEMSGTLKLTDTIQIIVSKTDLIGTLDYEQRKTHADNFLSKYYDNFRENMRRLILQYSKTINRFEQKGKEIIFHPFTIGKFYLQEFFEYDPSDAFRVLDELLRNTQAIKKDSMLKSIIKGNKK